MIDSLILDVRNLTKKFGELIAVNNVSLTVNEGEVLGVIGPNGSGKTTLLNLISGIYEKNDGEIYLKGERIDHLMPNEIALRGVARTFQIPKLFRNMTVKENLLVPAKALFKFHDRYEVEKRILELLRFVGLESLKNELAKNLSGGQQKLLEIARAFVINPILALLDEPFAGVNPIIKDTIFSTIKAMNKNGVAFIIVSHEMPSIAYLCNRVIVLDSGIKIAEGTLEEVARDMRVIEAYIGGKREF